MKKQPLGVLLVSSVLAACVLSTSCSKATGPYFHQTESIGDNEAIVYLYRPPGAFAHLHTLQIFSDGQLVARLYDGSYIPYHAKIGTITFSFSQEGRGPRVTILAESGKSYFVKQWMKEHVNPIRSGFEPMLEQVSEDDGLAELRDCRLIQP